MSVVPVAVGGNVARMNSLVTTSGSVMNFKYDRHDVNVTFPSGHVDLRALNVGTTIELKNFWNGDKLQISAIKHSTNPDMTQDMDFSLLLGKGGDAKVFVHSGQNYFTIKGQIFCGRSAAHVVFENMIRPMLEGKINIKNEIKEEPKIMAAIIDLTEEEEQEGGINISDEDKDEYVEKVLSDVKVELKIQEEPGHESNLIKSEIAVDVKQEISVDVKEELEVKREVASSSPRQSAMALPLVLSSQLAELLGTGGKLLSRTQVTETDTPGHCQTNREVGK